MTCRVWSGVPLSVRLTTAAAATVFAYGTVPHAAELVTHGAHPYASAPAWLAAYFVSLTVLDPMVAALLALRRLAGLRLGSAVLVTDAVANAYANYVLDAASGVTPGRVGQAAVAILAIGLLAVYPVLAPWLRRPLHVTETSQRANDVTPGSLGLRRRGPRPRR